MRKNSIRIVSVLPGSVAALIALSLAAATPLAQSAEAQSAEAQSAESLSPTRVIRIGSASHETTEPQAETDRGESVVSGVGLSADGDLLAVTGDDHLVRIFELRGDEQPRRLPAHADWGRAVAFHPDGKKIAAAGDDRVVRTLNASDGNQTRELGRHAKPIRSLAYSPDGKMLAAGGFERKVRVYGDDGRLLQTLDAVGNDVRCLVFSPTGSHLAATGRNGVVRIWETATWSVAADLKDGTHDTKVLAYSPEGTHLAAAGRSDAIRVWNRRSGESFEIEMPPKTGTIGAMVFCSEDMLAVGGSDNVIRLWSLGTQRQQSRLVGHTGSISSLAYHASTARLFSGSYDTTVCVWQLGGPNGPNKEELSRRGGYRYGEPIGR